jgi:hypothetical protein
LGNEEVGYTILNTAGGEDIKVPTQTGFSTGSATAEAAAFAVSNPATSSLTLRSHKFGTLLTVSRELLEDAGIDIVGFLGRQAGNAIGNIVNQKLAIGTGTVEPNGIVNASGSGITGGTAVGGAFTADNLIDLVHSVDSEYAANRAGFQMRRARWRRSVSSRTARAGSSTTRRRALRHSCLATRCSRTRTSRLSVPAKSVIFGSMPYYHVRQVGGVEIARSDDAFFTTDLVAFRVSIRLDGDLSQADA